jgi:hypothetical protein
MSYQAPDEWRLQVHGPHHAAPLGACGPLRAHAHRALRLVAVAGAWAAGLCLVVGSVALVAGAEPPAATHVTAAAGVHRLPPAGSRPPHGRRQARRIFEGTVQRTFAGAGDQVTGQFTVAARSRWELRWSYACSRAVPAGHLLIRESGSDGVTVSASGASGQGTVWAWTRSPSHYLVVIANCGWTIQVTGSR